MDRHGDGGEAKRRLRSALARQQRRDGGGLAAKLRPPIVVAYRVGCAPDELPLRRSSTASPITRARLAAHRLALQPPSPPPTSSATVHGCGSRAPPERRHAGLITTLRRPTLSIRSSCPHIIRHIGSRCWGHGSASVPQRSRHLATHAQRRRPPCVAGERERGKGRRDMLGPIFFKNKSRPVCTPPRRMKPL